MSAVTDRPQERDIDGFVCAHLVAKAIPIYKAISLCAGLEEWLQVELCLYLAGRGMWGSHEVLRYEANELIDIWLEARPHMGASEPNIGIWLNCRHPAEDSATFVKRMREKIVQCDSHPLTSIGGRATKLYVFGVTTDPGDLNGYDSKYLRALAATRIIRYCRVVRGYPELGHNKPLYMIWWTRQTDRSKHSRSSSNAT